MATSGYLPPVRFDLKDYDASSPNPLASANAVSGPYTDLSSYDIWLRNQNRVLSSWQLPSTSTPYTAANPQNPYTPTPNPNPPPNPWPTPTQPPGPGTPPPGPGTPPPGPGSTPYTGGPVIGGGHVNSRGEYVTQTPYTATELQRQADRVALQGLVSSGNDAAALQYLRDHNLDAAFFNDALSYAGSPISNQGRSAENWLMDAAARNNVDVRGMNAPSDEQIRQYIAWQQNQRDVMGRNNREVWADAGITDPYSNQFLIDQARNTLARDERVSNQLAQTNADTGSNYSYDPGYYNYQTPAQSPAPSATPQSQDSGSSPAYQAVAGSFVNENGEVINYDSNGQHTATGVFVGGGPQESYTPAPAPAPSASSNDDPWGLNSDNRARGGLIHLGHKYGVR